MATSNTAEDGPVYKTYTITEKAGRYVAGQRNGGVGTSISLTEKQAEAALRGGEIVAADEDTLVVKPAAQPLIDDEPKKPAEKAAKSA